MYLSTLQEWLAWINGLHTAEMDLGLDRVKQVAARLALLSLPCPVIIVGGTNGKGSTVAGLESIYRASKRKVGAFTSPILFKHNEYVRINGENAADDDFCRAYEKIEAVRGSITLTPFEYHTLAALLIFKQAALDVVILEVGLGGRLDAVNIIDADVAVITSIGIDHIEWLGTTRETIGYEKAGIFRADKPAVCGDEEPPASILQCADKLGTRLYCQGKDFYYQMKDQSWCWFGKDISYQSLPYNSLLLQNMSTVLMTVTLLQDKLPVTQQAIVEGLRQVELTGRIQIMPGSVMKVFDVSHNPAAASVLAKKIVSMPCHGKTYAVFSMLADKDMLSSIHAIDAVIDEWYVAPLSVKRAADMKQLQVNFSAAGITQVHFCDAITDAYTEAEKRAAAGDRIIVFGSFHTVAQVMERIRR